MRIIALLCGLLLIISGCTQESREAEDRPVTQEGQDTEERPVTRESQDAGDQPVTQEGPAAEDRPVKLLGDGIRAYYSAYKSTFLEPKIAEAYDIVRASDRGVVNISVVSEDSPYGIKADVNGVANNLMAMRQELDFFEVKEGDAVYHLATFEFNDEEVLSFEITIQPEGRDFTEEVTFQRTFRIGD